MLQRDTKRELEREIDRHQDRWTDRQTGRHIVRERNVYVALVLHTFKHANRVMSNFYTAKTHH